MNEKRIALAVLGLVIALEGFVANEIFMMLARDNNYISPGTVTHSTPVIIATTWLLLIPFGFILVLISGVLELRDRYRRKDSTEIWEQ